LLVLIGVPLGFWLGDNAIERALMIGVLFIVIIVELLNTAVEVTIDRIGFERHELSARAKDIGSAAVLTSLLLAGLVWYLMLTD
jgi:diacylglycerol kinase (ATP)